ncbi:UDP-2,3-diacylglucosamine hydrolase, partial [Aeromonas allosaccharophila]
RRIVLGDWFEQGSVLICRPGEQRLEMRALAMIDPAAHPSV